MALTASFLGGTTPLSGHRSSATTSHRRPLVIANTARVGAEKEAVKSYLSCESKGEGTSNGRRDLVFAAAAAAICSVAGAAVAEELKPGSPEAQKIYGPVCVSMPTARICHK
ncbi:photosystem II 5 kDa protein, chloroplastic-like [Malania oleifera]|uniref:photosystem II 5 kDa protein, chloroplastic-like n=1 Tax=Malania oleifera TaxID=397392 RepID=UPI0025AE3A21|nr:photosystem II 5 kDa protein, chloroplastic-like [Malania oleifera]